MTAIPSWSITCDGCSDDPPNPDLGARTAADARAEAARVADYIHRGGKDWCTACQTNGTMTATLTRDRLRRAHAPRTTTRGRR